MWCLWIGFDGFVFVGFEGIASVRCHITRMTSWCSARGAKTGDFFKFFYFLVYCAFFRFELLDVLCCLT